MAPPDLLNPDDYDDAPIDDPDNPEWTEADFARARPVGEVAPGVGHAACDPQSACSAAAASP